MDSRRPAHLSASASHQDFLDVGAMSITARVEESLRRSVPMVPLASQELVRGLLSPKAVSEMAITITVWATSQLIGAGEVADLVLLLAGYVMLGKTALDAGKELVAFGSVIGRARVSQDLDVAARHFANAVMLAGVTTISAVLLRKAGVRRTSESLAGKAEGTTVKAVGETPYQQAVKTLDLKVIKKIVVEAWQQPRKWPVKVFALRAGQKLGDAVAVDGYITTEQSIAGASLRELERRMGLEPGYLGNSAAIVRLDRLPTASEFDLRFYNNIHGGGVKPPNPRFPLGPGYPQWELLQKVPGRITQVISK
jgi:hypothetical protein